MANFLSTSLKNLFISLGASKTSDNNYAVPLLNATTKEPVGDMTIRQLASVLGVARYKDVANEDDLNRIFSSGNYLVHFASVPSWATEYMWLEVTYQSNANIIQRLTKVPSPKEVIYRYIRISSGEVTVNKYKYTGTVIT